MIRFILFLFIFFPLSIQSQRLTGSWEGDLFINPAEDQIFRLQMELNDDSTGQVWGVAYIRTITDNVVVGCDYMMLGKIKGKKLSLTWDKLIRNTGVDRSTCSMLRNIVAELDTSSFAPTLKGNWFTLNGTPARFICFNISKVFSAIAEEDVGDYVNDLYTNYERKNLFLPVSERQTYTASKIEVEGREFILDIRCDSLQLGDSVNLIVNGEAIKVNHNIFSSPLRIKVLFQGGDANEIFLVNNSGTHSRYELRVAVEADDQQYNFIARPTWARNPLINITRKQVSQ